MLEMYDVAVQTYRDYYQYEEIEGSYRKKSTLYQRRHSVNLLQTHSFIEHGI